jgi:hypothetical protein
MRAATGCVETADLKRCARMCQKLIDLGADRSTTNASGKTALHSFRASIRSLKDARGAFNLVLSTDALHVEDSSCSRLEAILAPPGFTATASDEDDGEDSESESDGEFDV